VALPYDDALTSPFDSALSDQLEHWRLDRVASMAGAQFGWLNDVFGGIFGGLGDLGNALSGAFRDLWNKIWFGVGGFVRWVADGVQNHMNWLQGTLIGSFTWVRNAAGGLAGYLSQIPWDVWEWATWFLWRGATWISGHAYGAFGWVTDQLWSAASWSWAQVSGAVSGLSGVIWDAAGWLWFQVSGAVSGVSGVVWNAAGWLWSQVSGAVSGLPGVIWDAAGFVNKYLGDVSAWLTNQVWSGVGWLWQQTSSAVSGAASTIVDGFGFVADKLVDGFEKFKDLIADGLKAGLGLLAPAQEIVDTVEAKLAIPGKLIHGEYTDFLDFWEDLRDPAPIIIAGFIGGLIVTIIVSMVTSSVMQVLFNPLLEPHVQDSRARVGAELVPTTLLHEAWNRGFVDEALATDHLERQGYSGQALQAVKALRLRLPGPNDLIRMGVREVFTPEIAERFGQFQDFPSRFGEEMAKQGYEQEWATAYWAAHWDLPSATQGFEMLHRRVIDDQELALLLRALDVMPYWRDRLTQISYNPLTRVDVRRMFALGVLNEQEIYEAYLDIGYNPQNAQRLTEFTKRFSAPDEDGELKDMRDLTQSQVRLGYRRNVIDRERAIDLLMDAGYSEDVAEFFLSIDDVALGINPLGDEPVDVRELTQGVILRAYREGLWERDRAAAEIEALGYLPTSSELLLSLEDLALSRELLEATVRLVHERYVAFEIDSGAADADLTTAGVGPARRELLLADWEGDRQRGARKLSVADLFKALKTGIMAEDGVFAYLLRLGYTQEDADVIFQLRGEA